MVEEISGALEHNDALRLLNSNLAIQERLLAIHEDMKIHFPFIARIAVALYDPQSNELKTYIHSSGSDNPLSNYQTSFENAQHLKAVSISGQPRIINNHGYYQESDSYHSLRIREAGYASSYTLPMYENGVFFGFVFINSFQPNVFTEPRLEQIDVYAHLISTMVINELASIRTLAAALKTTRNITHMRDPETGAHLERMSRYSRMIASHLADRLSLNDAYIEHVFMYAPLHDLGKVGIPDNILLKPGPLTEKEAAIMQTHTLKGRQMIDAMIKNFGLDAVGDIDMLRNITELHHEAINGSGYPHGLRGNEIPLEARIVSVADVFDALSSQRPYKKAWPNDKSLSELATLSGDILDKDCVDIMVNNHDIVESIQQNFQEDDLG